MPLADELVDSDQRGYEMELLGVVDPKVVRFTDIVGEMVNLYAKKNHDYGDSFSKMHQEFGMTHAIIRMQDKLNRLKALNNEGAQVSESVRDTLIDLACYAVMTIMETENE